MSYDLRHTYHSWTGTYGNYAVPANNPSDIWVTSGTAATEVNQYERPVAPTVAIPPGTGVVGQAGPNLVLLGSPPTQLLELWSPAQQRVLATFGAQEYSDADPTANQDSVVWSDRNVVHIDGANGVPGPVVIGPSGEVATSLTLSPDGTRVAIVFQGAPGTTGARNEGVVDIADMSDGAHRTVPGSAGARGLLAWSPDGSRIFFPKLNRADTSVTMASYRIGSKGATSFKIPGRPPSHQIQRRLRIGRRGWCTCQGLTGLQLSASRAPARRPSGPNRGRGRSSRHRAGWGSSAARCRRRRSPHPGPVAR